MTRGAGGVPRARRPRRQGPRRLELLRSTTSPWRRARRGYRACRCCAWRWRWRSRHGRAGGRGRQLARLGHGAGLDRARLRRRSSASAAAPPSSASAASAKPRAQRARPVAHSISCSPAGTATARKATSARSASPGAPSTRTSQPGNQASAEHDHGRRARRACAASTRSGASTRDLDLALGSARRRPPHLRARRARARAARGARVEVRRDQRGDGGLCSPRGSRRADADAPRARQRAGVGEHAACGGVRRRRAAAGVQALVARGEPAGGSGLATRDTEKRSRIGGALGCFGQSDAAVVGCAVRSVGVGGRHARSAWCATASAAARTRRR